MRAFVYLGLVLGLWCSSLGRSMRPRRVSGPNINKTRLHHDSWRQRSTVLESGFYNEPGVAQTVHWARTTGFDLNGQILEALIESDVRTEDGLVDGLMTNLPYQKEVEENEAVVVFGQATHVGCGWIQFPSASSATEDERDTYENFMVCNYGVGLASKTTCDSLTKKQNNETLIKYYSVTSEIIKDVKTCLEAVRCRRRRRKFFKTFTQDEAVQERRSDDPCSADVRQCLSGRSGLKFVDATKLKSVARSVDLQPIDMEAAKCKIDTILCSLNSTSICKERLEYCLPLIDVDSEDGKVLCECADLVLTDGTHGDCTEKLPDRDGLLKEFCFVKQSPCVSIDPAGHLEMSQPYNETEGLLHYTHLIC